MPAVVLPEAIHENIFDEVKMSKDIEKSAKNEEKTQNKNPLIEWCLETNAHGLGNIFKSDNWFLRIIWIILTLASAAGCLYCKSNIINSKF